MRSGTGVKARCQSGREALQGSPGWFLMLRGSRSHGDWQAVLGTGTPPVVISGPTTDISFIPIQKHTNAFPRKKNS